MGFSQYMKKNYTFSCRNWNEAKSIRTVSGDVSVYQFRISSDDDTGSRRLIRKDWF